MSDPAKPKRGGYRKDRPRPTAYLNGARETVTKGLDRGVVLSTGRGCTCVSPDEAEALAAELVAAARAHRARREGAVPA